jgi:enoyl-CoA hydratase/carnithine racemase
MPPLITEQHDEILLIRFNRPERRNALNLALLEELISVLDRASADDRLRALVITGNAQAFSAGQDLKEEEPPDYVRTINAACSRLEQIGKPTVAAIDGWCIAGGLELALCCDLRVCADTARIGDWHARINSIGGAGATVRLVRTVGLARAKELVFSGQALDAEAARNAGLVSHVFSAAELIERSIAFARSLCVGSPTTVNYAKKSLNAAADLALAEALAFALQCQHTLREAQSGSYSDRFSARETKPK